MFTESQTTAANADPSSLIHDNPSIESYITASTGDKDRSRCWWHRRKCRCHWNVIYHGYLPLQLSMLSKFWDSSSTYCCRIGEIKKSGRQTRSIQTSWYVKYPWISVCTTSYNIFCHVCCNAKKNLIHFSSHYDPTLWKGVFPVGKKALRDLLVTKSEMHQEAIMKLAAKSSRIDIKCEWNKIIMPCSESTCYLARLGLAFHGHHEDSIAFEGNLHQLLLLQAKDSIQLASWIKKSDITSLQQLLMK